jgi:hypothetical protein
LQYLVNSKAKYLQNIFHKKFLPRLDDEPPQNTVNLQTPFPRRVTGAERVREEARPLNCVIPTSPFLPAADTTPTPTHLRSQHSYDINSIRHFE